MPEDLKPCPFCGGQPYLAPCKRYKSPTDPGTHLVRYACGCLYGLGSWLRGEPTAREVWNHRFDPAQQKESL